MKSLGLFAALLLLSGIVRARIDHYTNDRGDLIFSHVLYRHGDRTPTYPYPNDPYDISFWKVPWGTLTNQGKQMHYALGKWLRQRYGNILLSDTYTSDEINVRSTDVDRTLQSAQCNLAGLYPPKDDQIWNPALHWQPIPVHTVSADDDWLIGGSLPQCHAYDVALLKLGISRGFLDSFNSSDAILKYISDNAGYQTLPAMAGLIGVVLVRDNLYIEDMHNFRLPEWTKKIYPNEEVDRLAQMSYNIPAYTPFLAKFRSGFLIKDILDRSDAKYNGTLSPNINVQVYSTHDTVMATLLYSLGISTNDFVHYAACLMFELRSTPTGPNIEIFYKKASYTNEAKPLFVPNCGYSCPVATFRKLYKKILPTLDFDTLCQL